MKLTTKSFFVMSLTVGVMLGVIWIGSNLLNRSALAATANTNTRTGSASIVPAGYIASEDPNIMFFADYKNWPSSTVKNPNDTRLTSLQLISQWSSDRNAFNIVDINGDGVNDIVYAALNPGNTSANGRFAVLSNKGDATFDVLYKCVLLYISETMSTMMYYGDCAAGSK